MPPPDRPDHSHLADLRGQLDVAKLIGDLFTGLVPVLKRVLGQEHPDILTDSANVLYWASGTRLSE